MDCNKFLQMVHPKTDAFEVSVAPMVGISTPEYRDFMRLVSPSSLVFTEMVVDTTLIHMSSEALEQKIGLPSDQCVLQLGGSCPFLISKAAVRARALGYTKMNLNCGCPSSRVQERQFGAVLMLRPDLIADIVNEVYKHTGVILSIKCRIGVDETEDYITFRNMIDVIVDKSPCRTFYVHARRCLLQGLSPAENRKVPVLRYDYVFRLKEERPDLTIILNGGLREVEQILAVKGRVDGVMLGRKPMDDPMFFDEIEQKVYGNSPRTRLFCVEQYLSLLFLRPDRRERFLELDPGNKTERISKCTGNEQDPNSTRIEAGKQENRENNKKQKEEGIKSPIHCKYADLKPIQAVLYGRRGCKQYKRKLAELAQSKAALTEILPVLRPYFLYVVEEKQPSDCCSEQ